MDDVTDHGQREKDTEKDARKSFYSDENDSTLRFGNPKRFDDEMGCVELRKLENIFRNRNGGKGLDIEQFRSAMKETLGYDIDDSELDVIFMKVDTSSDGTVHWDEYLSYTLLEHQEKENMESIYATTPFPHALDKKYGNHLESICSISLQQQYSMRYNGRVELDEDASRYVTLSKDGVLNVWNTDWTLQKSTTLDGMRSNPRSVWFTDLVCMPNCNMVAVASTDYEISFYSLSSNRSMFQKKFQIRDMESCALTIDYHFEFAYAKRSVLLWGDTSGGIILIRFYDNPNLALFSSACVSDKKIQFSSLLKTQIHNVKIARFQNLLPEWVKELHFYANDKNQEFFVACCRNSVRSMVFADITDKVTEYSTRKMEIRRKSSFCIRNGVSCVAYDPEWNVVATGSSDYHIRIWNPYVVTAPTTTLKGHVMPVHQIYIRQIDHHVISVSKDKNVRIWNLLDYSCKQSIHGRHVELGRLDITAMYYNEANMQLILGSNMLGVFVGNSANLAQANKKRSDPISHIKPITKVLYNSLFKMLVTCSEDSMISVWDIRTGAKTMQFITERGIELSAMAFDPSQRRLITGSRNGKISMWNFNNGARLRDFETANIMEVSDIIHAKNRIISAGWDKHVTIYPDSYTDGSFRRMKQMHRDDILSMDYHISENLLGTSSYDGEIIIWSLDMESIICRLDMHRSVLPIYEKGENVTPSGGTGSCSSFTHSLNHFIYLPGNLPWITDRGDLVDGFSGQQRSSKDNIPGKTAIRHAVNKIIFFQSRRSSNNVGVLACATMRYVLVWSVHQTGGILAHFNAVKDSSDTVVEVASDQENKLLFTGDNQGYIRVWDIHDYCYGADVDARRRKQLERRRPCLVDKHELTSRYYIPINTPPELLTSFRGHCKAITTITYVDKSELIVSGSADCSVRLWTLRGRYIGTFGQNMHWAISTPINERALPPIIPLDVRRVASPETLYTVKGGYHHHWKHVRHAVEFIGRFRRIAKCFQVPESNKKKDIKQRLSEVGEDLIENAKSEGGARRRSVTVWVEDQPHSIHNAAAKKEEKVNSMWQEIQDNGISSKVLGKINYKPRRRHRTVAIDAKINWLGQSPIVYRTLPCSDLEEPIKPTIPEYFMEKIASQNAGSLPRTSHRSVERRKFMSIPMAARKIQSAQPLRRNSKN